MGPKGEGRCLGKTPSLKTVLALELKVEWRNVTQKPDIFNIIGGHRKEKSRWGWGKKDSKKGHPIMDNSLGTVGSKINSGGKPVPSAIKNTGMSNPRPGPRGKKSKGCHKYKK